MILNRMRSPEHIGWLLSSLAEDNFNKGFRRFKDLSLKDKIKALTYALSCVEESLNHATSSEVIHLYEELKCQLTSLDFETTGIYPQ